MHVVYEIGLTDGRTAVIRARLASTTGDHLGWSLALAHGDSFLLHLVDYATRFVDSVRVDKILEDGCVSSVHGMSVETLSGLCELRSLIGLCETIATFRTLPKGFADNYQRWWAAIYGANAYDPSKATKTCECPHCSRGLEQDASCVFWNIDESAQILGSHDWELALQCWSLPVEVYQMVLSQKRQRTLGDAADRQERDEKRERDERHKAANSPASWAAATAARAKVIEDLRRQKVQRGES